MNRSLKQLPGRRNRNYREWSGVSTLDEGIVPRSAEFQPANLGRNCGRQKGETSFQRGFGVRVHYHQVLRRSLTY